VKIFSQNKNIKMKKLTICMLMGLVLLSLAPMPAIAGIAANTVPVDSTKNIEMVESRALTQRLEEINAMDKSSLSSTEKRELRKEVRSIKKRANSGGVYISVGALLIVIILLILLL